MDFILDLVLEDSITTSNNKKNFKLPRYIILGVISLIYIAIIGLIIIAGIDKLKNDLLEGILIIIFGLSFLLFCIMRFKSLYQKRDK